MRYWWVNQKQTYRHEGKRPATTPTARPQERGQVHLLRSLGEKLPPAGANFER